MTLVQQLREVVTKSINSNDPKPFIAMAGNTYSKLVDHLADHATVLYDEYKTDVSHEDRLSEISDEVNNMYLKYVRDHDILNKGL